MRDCTCSGSDMPVLGVDDDSDVGELSEDAAAFRNGLRGDRGDEPCATRHQAVRLRYRARY